MGGARLAAAASPDVLDFYKTVSAISFTLLGLWWVVAQVKYSEWAVDPRRRRQAYAVSLYFLLPGVMTMLAAINGQIGLLWRLSFGISGALGLLEVVLYFGGGIRTVAASALRLAAVAVYGLIVVLALFPSLSGSFGLAPRELESVLVGLLIVVGVNIAWFVFTEPPPRSQG